ncbi:MAG TPA: peptide chain release factor 2 [Thermodesulfovibrionales bacterium]|nr:peptide chain release factor 2 [Thermodesulfovibrionales bacterium]
MLRVDEIRQELLNLRLKTEALRGYLDVKALQESIKSLNGELSQESSWSSPEKLHELQKRRAQLENIIAPFEVVEEKLSYIENSLDILEEEGGEAFLKEIGDEIAALGESIKNIELRHLLSGEIDINDAIITIHPGAGGTESQDWAQILMRMYLRWAEKHGFHTEIVDLLPGEEAGIKSVTITVSGPYAYGHLKAEAGVHRLVRISPFDANKRRHTSFSAVLVFPEIEEDIHIEINEDDLKIDTFRASGAGGQHVNKTSSAVRITHIPSGIIVTCQNERSQHKNKAMAMKILRARLYDLQLKEQEKKVEGIVGNKKGISWGNQIRSYTLQPYRLVKDHRTAMESGNVDAILDGDIDLFIDAYLRAKNKAA